MCTRISSVSFNRLSSEAMENRQQNLILHHSLEVTNSDLRKLQNIFAFQEMSTDSAEEQVHLS
jgi:hypothetical protein